jgi:5-oxoprolinase (ATP-hydrolysing)
MTDSGWRFYIDRGGTFTDVVAQAPDGTLSSLKLLSEDARYDDAALEGIRRRLGLPSNAEIPASSVEELRVGTTVATNALLERRGEPVVLVTTRGFRDQFRIGYQNRPKLFALNIERAPPLYTGVVEAGERVSAEGEVLRALDEALLRRDLASARAKGFSACAIVFLHGYRYPAHERRAAQIAGELGFAQISASHETIPLMKLVSRGDTTVADAYLSPVLSRYAQQIAAGLGGKGKRPRLFFMMSNGGLAAPELFHGKDAVLSGPAGGVVGMAETAQAAGFDRVIGFDMGGTSTDVSRFDGIYERNLDNEIAGVRLRVPMMAVHTIAAGGGSVLHYDGTRFRVGPDSAGAAPGPKSYRGGGPLTVTDANVMTGKLQPQYFPKIFGHGRNQPLDAEDVREAFGELARDSGRSPEEVADGFVRIAVDNMANAIKRISVARGYDARTYALACFGGAAGQHACLVADALGISRIFIHPFSGVLSAYGMRLAAIRAFRQRAIGRTLDASLAAALAQHARELAREAVAEVEAQGGSNVAAQVSAHIRYVRSDTTLPVPLGGADDMARAFATSHARQFGFGFEDRPLIVESIEIEAFSRDAAGGARITTEAHSAEQGFATNSQFYSHGAWHECTVHTGGRFAPGRIADGPALIVQPNQTVVVEPGWLADSTAEGAVVLSRVEKTAATKPVGEAPDPVLLEVFANLFMQIAEEMGATLQNTASSVNIKERLDFSCAIFDGNGNLVANAPHMPVHLGSMGDCVASVIARYGSEIAEGDMFATNAPYNGGTHLPDVTVVAPVFVDHVCRFFAAARGHHADIGGISPGSMPPFSCTIEEEGALFDNVRIDRAEHFDERAVRDILESGPYPARNPAQNIADLKAQVAACTRAISELRRSSQAYGATTLAAYMGHVQDNAEDSVRRVVSALNDGTFVMPVDGGIHICVRIVVDRENRRARIDFTGTSPQSDSNLNAPRSVTKAAVLYVFRCLVPGDIPLNAGCLRPLEIVIPEGSLLNPSYPAAVAGGNVETSQAVVDALFGALGVMAAAQGTMNNLTFGNSGHQYYETICGGAGAGADFDGASAVHTHMTNSRLTDPEVLETRYPVLIEEFAIREGSGGRGSHRGGDGVLRRIRFREAMTAAILSTRRETVPFGLFGGDAGLPGANMLIRADGETVALRGRDEIAVEPGDEILIATPGGGGFGEATKQR